jgi:hypothetical protein
MPIRTSSLLSSSGLPLGFMHIPIPIVQHSATNIGTITINPRWNDSTAQTKLFDSSVDYAPGAAAGGNAYVDISLPMFPHHDSWMNKVHDSNYGRRTGTGTAISDVGRVSLWAQLGVGDSPHPGEDYAYTHVAMLMNQAGAYHSYITTGSPTPNYAEPRTLGGGGNSLGSFANFKVSGQYYGGGTYGGWYCLANYSPGLFGSSDTLRVINLGGNTDARSRLRIVDMVYIIHGKLGTSGV